MDDTHYEAAFKRVETKVLDVRKQVIEFSMKLIGAARSGAALEKWTTFAPGRDRSHSLSRYVLWSKPSINHPTLYSPPYQSTRIDLTTTPSPSTAIDAQTTSALDAFPFPTTNRRKKSETHLGNEAPDLRHAVGC